MHSQGCVPVRARLQGGGTALSPATASGADGGVQGGRVIRLAGGRECRCGGSGLRLVCRQRSRCRPVAVRLLAGLRQGQHDMVVGTGIAQFGKQGQRDRDQDRAAAGRHGPALPAGQAGAGPGGRRRA
jgi:hypothetical protein